MVWGPETVALYHPGSLYLLWRKYRTRGTVLVACTGIILVYVLPVRTLLDLLYIINYFFVSACRHA
jgi:hypothetical protein